MVTALRYFKTQTRRVQVQCCLATVMTCSLLYLSVTAFLPYNTEWRLDQNFANSRLWTSGYRAEITHTMPLRKTHRQAYSFYSVSEHFQNTPALHRTPSLTLIRAESVARYDVQEKEARGRLEHGILFRDATARNGNGPVVKKAETEKYDFVFPELNVSSLTCIDLSRVGQLNLLYFDTTRYMYHTVYPKTNITKRMASEERQKTQFWIQENTTEPMTEADLHMAFQPIISHDERLLMLFIFQTFIHLCEANDLMYFLYGGSLLGAYRHHDVIPWDDDIDVMMAARQRPLVAKMLRSMPEFGLWTPPGRQWKFYWKKSPTLKHKKYRWPYIDIFFFNSNGTHVYDDSREYRADFRFPLSHIFPLQLRPFAGALLPVPCNMAAVLRVNYFPWLCVTSSFLHKLESSAPRHLKARVACRRLLSLFSFVLRQQPDDLSVTETLIKGSQVLSRTVMPAFCGQPESMNSPIQR